MVVTDFEQRRKEILESLIEVYVSTATPVGSEAIARRLRPTISPATIRNTMVRLEEAGLLEQPHTSAGRVPTRRGYRFYVDSIMEVRWLSPEEIRRIERALQAESQELDQLPERISAVLSDLTQQAAFVVAPTVKSSTVRQIELVPLSVHKMLCVLVGSESRYASHVIEVEEPLSRDEAAALARFINTELVGRRFSELLTVLERRLLAEHDSFYYLVKRSLAILEHALSTEPNERFVLGGTRYVVAQPEFRRDPRRAELFLKGLEEQAGLIGRVRDDLGVGTVQVRIGDELHVDELTSCSYVTAPFAVGGTVIGGVGVLGPTRMDYRRIAAQVEGMARAVTEILSLEGADES